MEEEEVRKLSVIYKKETSRPLSKYQVAMNKAAQSLCISQPGLLRKRLMELAREKLLADGFRFVKGKSRSKKLASPAEGSKQKRTKLSQEIRDKRLNELQEDISDLKERLTFKEKRIEERLNLRDYKKCDDLKEEVMELRKKLRETELEKKTLSKSNRRSLLYLQRQTSSSNESDSKSFDIFSSPSPDRFSSSHGSCISPPFSPSCSFSDVPNFTPGVNDSAQASSPDTLSAHSTDDYLQSTEMDTSCSTCTGAVRSFQIDTSWHCESYTLQHCEGDSPHSCEGDPQPCEGDAPEPCQGDPQPCEGVASQLCDDDAREGDTPQPCQGDPQPCEGVAPQLSEGDAREGDAPQPCEGDSSFDPNLI